MRKWYLTRMRRRRCNVCDLSLYSILFWFYFIHQSSLNTQVYNYACRKRNAFGNEVYSIWLHGNILLILAIGISRVTIVLNANISYWFRAHSDGQNVPWLIICLKPLKMQLLHDWVSCLSLIAFHWVVMEPFLAGLSPVHLAIGAITSYFTRTHQETV